MIAGAGQQRYCLRMTTQPQETEGLLTLGNRAANQSTTGAFKIESGIRPDHGFRSGARPAPRALHPRLIKSQTLRNRQGQHLVNAVGAPQELLSQFLKAFGWNRVFLSDVSFEESSIHSQPQGQASRSQQRCADQDQNTARGAQEMFTQESALDLPPGREANAECRS